MSSGECRAGWILQFSSTQDRSTRLESVLQLDWCPDPTPLLKLKFWFTKLCNVLTLDQAGSFAQVAVVVTCYNAHVYKEHVSIDWLVQKWCTLQVTGGFSITTATNLDGAKVGTTQMGVTAHELPHLPQVQDATELEEVRGEGWVPVNHPMRPSKMGVLLERSPNVMVKTWLCFPVLGCAGVHLAYEPAGSWTPNETMVNLPS